MKNLLYTLLLFPLFAFSQLSFDGVVKDKLTATELEKALVTVKPRRLSGAGFYSGVYTKADGAFEVTTSFNYPLEIIITKKGCTRKVIKIKKGKTYIDVVMECEAATIEQIIVEKQRKRQLYRQLKKRSPKNTGSSGLLSGETGTRTLATVTRRQISNLLHYHSGTSPRFLITEVQM